jgi:hypothetical protein
MAYTLFNTLSKMQEAIDEIVNQYIETFNLNRDDKKKFVDDFKEIYKIQEMSEEEAKITLADVEYVMMQVEEEAGAEFPEMKRWRKVVEELGSILRIAKSHEASAIKRLEEIIKMPVKPERVIKPPIW